VQKLVEQGVDGKDIERILRALGECPGQELAGAASVVQGMVEHRVDAKDIERVLRALGEHPEQDPDHVACSSIDRFAFAWRL
jgi:hypothetical protein